MSDQPAQHLDATRHPWLTGVLAAAAVTAVLWLVPLPWALDGAALLLAALGGVYIGTAVARTGGGRAWVEFIVLAVYLLLAFLGTRLTPWLLVVGFAGHALWDVLHHAGWGGLARPARWYVPLCVVFDLLIAAALVWRFDLLAVTP